MSRAKIDLQLLDRALYTYAEAAYLAGTSRGTARRWLAGYQFRDSQGKVVKRPPVTPGADHNLNGVSFLDLIELVAIGGLKEMGLSLLQIRTVVENCQHLFKVARPLVSLELKAGGREVFARSQPGELVEVLSKGRGRRAWDEVLAPFLDTLDYDHDLARRWWPLGHETPVCVDPEYGFGLPVIHNSGVRTEVILERFQAGEHREEIAADFGISESDVDGAIRFEASRFKRAA